VKEVELEQDFP